MVTEHWKEFLPKPKLKHYVSSVIEVGFTQYGPTLVISGTLTTTSKVMFIQEISVILERKRDGSRHLLNWFAFLPHSYNFQGLKGIDLKMAAKFMVTPEPYKYHIVFSDQDRYAYIKPVLTTIKEEWGKILQDHPHQNQEELFAAFLQEPVAITSLKELQKMSYWETGEYDVIINVATVKPKQDFQVKKSFRMTEDDIRGLKHNPVIIAADLCKQPLANYSFASPILT